RSTAKPSTLRAYKPALASTIGLAHALGAFIGFRRRSLVRPTASPSCRRKRLLNMVTSIWQDPIAELGPPLSRALLSSRRNASCMDTTIRSAREIGSRSSAGASPIRQTLRDGDDCACIHADINRHAIQ